MRIRKIKLKNKKAEGLLESETLRVIIALLCILLLAVLAYKLYGLFTKKTAVEQAKETFDQLVSKMNGLREGENDSYMITSPAFWALMSNGEQICICSFENEGASFFRYENREEAFRVCSTNGFCSPVKNNIRQFDTCGWGAFQSCIDLKELPLRIYLNKNQGIVSLRTKTESAISNKFENILNYKKDANSKTIRELIFDPEIINRKEPSFIQFLFSSSPYSAEAQKLREEIYNDVESYFSSIDTKKEFNIERAGVAWSMKISKLNDKGETEGAWIPIGQKYLTPVKVGGSTTSSYDIQGYRLILEVWEGQPPSSGWHMPSLPGGAA